MNQSCPRCDSVLFAEQQPEGWERFCICCGWRETPARIFRKLTPNQIGKHRPEAVRQALYSKITHLSGSGFSSAQIASRVGYSPAYVTQILKGRRA